MDPRVHEALVEVLAWTGNPSSVHAFGRKLRIALDDARSAVAKLIDVPANDVFFTSGATEGNNTVLLGYFRRLRELYGSDRELRLLVSAIEHSSVRVNLGRLEAELGVIIDKLPVDGDGVVDIKRVGNLLRDSTAMVCVMWANNIIGSLQPIAEIGRLISAIRQERGSNGLPLVFMSDAVQALRTESVKPREFGVDILTLSGHKIYGPRGVGAVYIRSDLELAPLIIGGEQEAGWRAGTENVAGIVGLGQAATNLLAERSVDRAKVVDLTQRLRTGLREQSELVVIGDTARSVPGILYVASTKLSGEILTLKLDAAGIAVSSGSACDAGTRKSASVLQEICSSQIARHGGLRLSLGRFNTQKEVQSVLQILSTLV
ncbi:cysteine desulfurase [Patescibacteria group bacterium]|nr:cysteine desulfurase [Patescibacteria group bacterium]